ncbi:hypothetical protein CIP107528_01223 [Corynebacterium diphtheriae]|nr:hypothetical protein CIP107525_01132 [Corynebacterium diphtheriae]CAB0553836.1 hypothetical protein CIP107528_01223 [Corynebacterium diphtheriae]
MIWRMPTKRIPTCAWCGKELNSNGRGRPKKFCSQSCRQRAYEQRHGSGAKTALPEGAVVLVPEKVENLRDALYELRCSAEDIATAADEGISVEDMKELCAELASLAKKIERLR